MKAVKKTALLSAVAALSLVPSAALALDGFWNGTALVGNDYLNPFNWSGFVIPGAGDRAVFSAPTAPRRPDFSTGTITNAQVLISGSTIPGPWLFTGIGGGGENWRVTNDITLINTVGNANATFSGVDVFAGITNITTGCSIQVTGSSSYNSDIDLLGNGSFTVDAGNTLRGVIDHQSTATSFVSGLLDTFATQIVNGGVLGIAPSGHIFLNGGIHTVSNGVLGFQDFSSQMTFDAGAELHVTGSGSVDFLGSHEFENGAMIRVTSGGRIVGGSFLDLGISGTGSVSVDGAGSSFAAPNNSFWGGGTSGVATVTFSNSGVGTLASLDIAQSSGSRGDVQLLSGGQLVTTSGLRVGPGSGTSSLARITVNGGNLNNNSTAVFRNGGQLVMSAGSVNFAGDATFSSGSTFTMSGGAVNLTAGRTLNIAGGIVNRTAGSGLSSLPNGSTLRITNGGQFTTNSFYDIANGASTGTMLVDGAGSRFNSTSSTTDWGQSAGNFATITFSNNGVGTYATGLQIADGGGRAVVNLLSSGQLNAAGLVVGGTASAATINIAGGTLNTLNAAQFNNGALVNFTSGGLLLNGNTTFSTGATLNKTGGNLTLAAGQTLAFNGGVGTNNTSMTLPNGASIRVTNAGRYDLGGFLDIANGVATGSLAVDGTNSRITALGTSDWGASAGNTATATFSNSGAGTFDSLRLARFNNGTANLSVSTNATLTAANFEAGSTGATALIQVNGGTLNVTGQAIFANGANVSTSGTGVLRLGGNGTFATGSTFNGSGLSLAPNVTLAFDGGVGTYLPAAGQVFQNQSLRVTTGGRFTAAEDFAIGRDSNASLLVDGTGSQFVTVNPAAQASAFGQSAGTTATITIQNSGAATIGQSLQVGIAGNAIVNVLSGGTLQANGIFTTFLGGAATFNVNGGTLRTTGGSNLNGGATLNVSAGTVDIGGTLGLGASDGVVQVNVGTGGLLKAAALETGQAAISTVNANITGGSINILGTSQFRNGTAVNVTAGSLNLGGNSTFNTGASLVVNGGGLELLPGRTLAFEGGVGSINGFLSIPNGSTFRVTNGGSLNIAQFMDIGFDLGASTGTLLVDGVNSRIQLSSPGGSVSAWANSPGSTANATFSNSGVGTFAGLAISNDTSTTTNLTIASGANLNVGSFTSGGVGPFAGGVSNINITGGSFNVLGTAQFRSGSNVNVSGTGVLRLGGNSTFSTGSTLNTPVFAAVSLADNITLAFDGGVGTINGLSNGLRDGQTLRVTNGGQFTATGRLNIGLLGNGTLLVDGPGSRFFSLVDVEGWGNGGIATVTFSNGGAGTINGGIQVAALTQALVNITSGGLLHTSGFFTTFANPTATATINVNGGTLRTTGNSNVNGGATLNFSSGTVNIAGTLGVGIVQQNARVLLTPGGNKVLRVGGLSIPAANNGKVDLSDNDMIIDYTGASPLGTIRAFLNTGRNGGNWLGNGLTSSAAAADSRTALGLVEATQLGSPATFFGQPIDNTTLLTRYTLYGDGNLDGTVNISDFAFLAANFNVATNSWFLGDYNYDGTTGIGDFALLASNFNLSLPGDLPRGGAVPEPGTLGLLGALAVTLQRRSRVK